MHSSQAAEPVRIALRPQSQVAASLITVGDVAEVTGGDRLLREQIAKLDVAEATKNGDLERITREQLQIRLLLAGLAAREFDVQGEPLTLVVRNSPSVDAPSILAEVGNMLAREWHAAPDDLDIALAQPLPANLIPEGVVASRLRIDPRLPAVAVPGRIQVSLHVYVDEQPIHILPVAVDAVLYRELARTTRLVSRGETFTEANVSGERVKVTSLQGGLGVDDIINRKSQRAIGPNTVLQLSDIAPAQNRSPILIRARDVVRITARKGGLTVSLAAAEALESGSHGDVIRARNPSSGKLLTGRVVGRNELEISLGYR